jgi:6-phosphogluconolactonase
MKLASVILLTTSLFAADRVAYVGTYTKPGASQGIYKITVNDSTGQISEPVLAAESSNPSFLAIGKGGKFVYAVNENRDGDVSAFWVEADGKLKFLNKAKSKGDAPCHLNIDKSGKWIAVANYSSGTVAILPIAADGKVGEAVATVQHKGSSVDPNRQQGPHAHSVNFSADNKFLFVADLGLDQVKVYAFNDKTGAITEAAQLEAPKGAGPRHAALGKDGFVYVINEMASSLSVFRFKAGEKSIQPITTVKAIPADYKENNSGAEVVLHPAGEIVFSSNRGHDSISIYRTSLLTGGTQLLGQQPIGGKTPRGFVLNPTGTLLIAGAQNSDQLFSFRVDAKAGKLTPVGNPVKVGSPVCIRFVK